MVDAFAEGESLQGLLCAVMFGFALLWKFIKCIQEELLIVLGTSSSESVLPRMTAKMENLRANKSVVGQGIPTGDSFNLDGTSICLTMAAVFIAQATHRPMTMGQQATLLLVLLLTSKGAAAVTSSGFMVLHPPDGAMRLLKEVKTRARLQFNAARHDQPALRLRDCLNQAARDLGFAPWDHGRRVLEGQAVPGDDMGSCWDAPACNPRLNGWFASLADARVVLAARRGAVLLPRRHRRRQLNALRAQLALQVAHVGEAGQPVAGRVPAGVEGQHVAVKHALEKAGLGAAVLQHQPVLRGVATNGREAQRTVEVARLLQVLHSQADGEVSGLRGGSAAEGLGSGDRAG